MNYNEFLVQKRTLSEWLGQDDFFAETNGKAGFRRPEAYMLSQLSMMYSRDKASSNSNQLKKRMQQKSRNNSQISIGLTGGGSTFDNQKESDLEMMARDDKPRQKHFVS